MKVCPTATWDVHTFKNVDGTDQPYMKNGTGSYVQVSVDVEGVVRTQIHPVLDHRNQTINEPNAFEINTSIQRCLAKAIALHGLGLYIFAGEDLPEPDALTQTQIDDMKAKAENIADKKVMQGVTDAIASGQVNSGNYVMSMKHIDKIIKEQDEQKKK